MDYEFWPFSYSLLEKNNKNFICSSKPTLGFADLFWLLANYFEFNLFVSLRHIFSLCLAFQWELHEHYVSNFWLRFFSADIVFIVKDKPHPIFKRDDDNLIYTATVPLGKVNKHCELKQ